MILVVGSTGSLGTAVVKGLAGAGEDVVALVRDKTSAKARDLESAGARLVVGDLRARPSLDTALRGADTVVCTASSTVSRREGDSIETVDRVGVQNLIDAAEAAGTPQFIYVSFSRNIGDDFPLAAAKRAAERRLESSSLNYTILLPSYFAETWFSPIVGFDVAGGSVRIYGDGNARVSYVAIEDVAKATIACVHNPGVARKAIPIGGPRAVSQLQAVALAEHVTGRTMRLEYMTAEQIAGARQVTTEPLTATFLGLFDALARGDEIPADWTRMLDVQPRSLEDWFAHSAK